jgi:hypothetical protein
MDIRTQVGDFATLQVEDRPELFDHRSLADWFPSAIDLFQPEWRTDHPK